MTIEKEISLSSHRRQSEGGEVSVLSMGSPVDEYTSKERVVGQPAAKVVLEGILFSGVGASLLFPVCCAVTTPSFPMPCFLSWFQGQCFFKQLPMLPLVMNSLWAILDESEHLCPHSLRQEFYNPALFTISG